MTIVDMLEELQIKALRDPEVKAALMATRTGKDPLMAFCRACQGLGYEIYPMELIVAGEEFYATYRRSTNGGGENAPKLKGQDDFYEMFFATLEVSE